MTITAPWDLQNGVTRMEPVSATRSKVRSEMWTVLLTAGRSRRDQEPISSFVNLEKIWAAKFRKLLESLQSYEIPWKIKCDIHLLYFYHHPNHCIVSYLILTKSLNMFL